MFSEVQTCKVYKHRLFYFPLAPLRYNFDMSNPAIHGDTIRVKEGESCDVSFETSSPDEYCYGHVLDRETNVSIRKDNVYVKGKSIHVRNASAKDAGRYEIRPSNTRWSGAKNFQLDVRCKLILAVFTILFNSSIASHIITAIDHYWVC